MLAVLATVLCVVGPTATGKTKMGVALAKRFNGEVEILLSRWRDQIEQGDPYYNPNLTLDNSDFSLRR